MKSILRAVSYFRADAKLITVLLGMIGASVVLNLLGAWPMAILVDTVLAQTPQANPIHSLFLAPFGSSRVAQIIGVAVLGMVLRILSETVMLARAMLNNHIRLNGTARLRKELFEKLQSLSLGWHRSQSQGDTIYRLSYDSNGPWGILDVLIGSSAALVTLCAMTVVMFWRSVPLTIAALGITPVLYLANRHFSRTIRRRAAQAKQTEAHFLIAGQRAMSLVPLIQTFGRERDEAEGFGLAVDRNVSAFVSLAWQESLYPLAVQTVFALGGAVIFGYGGYLVYQDQFVKPVPGGVTCGDLIVFMAYLGQLWDPLGWVLGFKTKIQTQSASCDRIFQILDEEPTIKTSPDATRIAVKPRTLTLADVGFSYAEGDLRLEALNVTIKPGQMAAFVGPSGAGKSTVLNLLMRFYDPTSGAVMLDRYDLRKLSVPDLRKHMAMVSQDSPLFPDTIAANLRYGCEDASEADLREAALDAGAADFIEALPDGYQTLVTEGGQNFSGGQRQRLAIARALLSKAPILVLDEPTSALDPENEKLVLAALDNLRHRRTIILVTHKIEAAALCDQIYVLSGGTIVERGTHQMLLAKRGVYAALAGCINAPVKEVA